MRAQAPCKATVSCLSENKMFNATVQCQDEDVEESAQILIARAVRVQCYVIPNRNCSFCMPTTNNQTCVFPLPLALAFDSVVSQGSELYTIEVQYPRLQLAPLFFHTTSNSAQTYPTPTSRQSSPPAYTGAFHALTLPLPF